MNPNSTYTFEEMTNLYQEIIKATTNREVAWNRLCQAYGEYAYENDLIIRADAAIREAYVERRRASLAKIAASSAPFVATPATSADAVGTARAAEANYQSAIARHETLVADRNARAARLPDLLAARDHAQSAYDRADEAVKQAKTFKLDDVVGFINAVLRSLLRARDAGELHLPDEASNPVKYLSIKYSVPEALINLLSEAYGFDTARSIIAYKSDEHFETIRPNLLRMSAAEFEAFLTEKGYEWRPGKVAGAYRTVKTGNLALTSEYAEGLFSLQGESAMLAVLALGCKRGQTVLDACAAPGGKAALMCELMQGSGRVYAWDLHEHRVDLMKSNGKRLRLDNLRCSENDATRHRADLVCTMDAVIIDAPCSGLGVLADKPDIKYRVSVENVKQLTVTQEQILNACAEYVKPGGTLVYSTCSILPCENEAQITRFLNTHSDYVLDTDVNYLPDEFKSLSNGGMLTLMQHRDGVEGFFIARLKRLK